MSPLELFLSGLEIVVEKIPVLGKLKSVTERSFPKRQLNPDEIVSDAWINRLCILLNGKFDLDYTRSCTAEQIRSWIEVYPNTFLVVVRRKIFTWPLNSESITSVVKILPLRRDYCALGEFEPYDVKPEQLVKDERRAQAVWVGDLVSTENDIFSMVITLKYILKDLEVPVYCRTVIKQLRQILMERYGAKVINPTGADATKSTILLLEPGSFRRSRKSRAKWQGAA